MNAFYTSNYIKNNRNNLTNKSYTKYNHKAIIDKNIYLLKLLEKNNKIGFINLLDFNRHRKSPNLNIKIYNLKRMNKLKISLKKYDNSPNSIINANNQPEQKYNNRIFFGKTFTNFKPSNFNKKLLINNFTDKDNNTKNNIPINRSNKKILPLSGSPLTILPYKQNPTKIENQKYRARKIYSMLLDFYIHDTINFLSDRDFDEKYRKNINNLYDAHSKMYQSFWTNKRKNSISLTNNNLFKEKSKMDSFIKGLPNIIKRYYKFKELDS